MNARAIMRWPGAVIFAVAFALRLVWVLTLDQSLMWPDEHEFVAIARHLAAGEGYVATTYRATPVLPFLLSLIFRVDAEGYLLARIVQSVLGALTCVIVYRTGRMLLGSGVGILSGLALAVYPPHIYLSGVFYAECLFTFLCAATIHFAVRSIDRPHAVLAGLLCGILFGLTTLTRTVMLAYAPVLCLALVYAARPAWRRQLPVVAIFVVAVAATILPWSFRNHAVHGKFILVSSGLGTKLWQGNNALATGGPDDRELYWNTLDWQARMYRLGKSERARLQREYSDVAHSVRQREERLGDRYLASDEVLGPLALDYMRSHPKRTVELFFLKVRTLFSPFTRTLTANAHVTPRNRMIAAGTFYPILLLAIVGAVLGLRERRALAIVYGFIGSLALAYGVLNSCTRFRLPLDPYLIMLAALACVHLARALPQRSSEALVDRIGGLDGGDLSPRRRRNAEA